MEQQNCHFDLTQNLNEGEKKSEYNTEKKSEFGYQNSPLYRNPYQIPRKKNLNFQSGHLNFTKFQEKNLNDSDKIWMNGRSGTAQSLK